MKTRGALFLCFVFSWFSGQASMEFNKRVSDAYLQIIHLELDKGHSILQDEVKQNPSNHLVLLYDNYIDFLKAFISEERNLYERFEKNYSARYEKIEDEKADTPWRLYALAEMKMQEAFLKIKFGEFKTSTLGMRAAYKLLEKNKRLYPSFLLNNKNLGMIHVVLGSVPSDYRWLIKLAGMKGTIPQGMKEINDTWSEIQKTDLSVYEEEILFYLSTIQSSLNVPAVEMKKTMAAIRPFTTVNPLMQYCYINLCIRSGNSRQALDMPGDSPSTRFPFHFLNYKKGTLLLFKLDMEAEHYFKLFLEKSSGMNFIKSAYQKIAWLYLINGNQNQYAVYMNLAKEKGVAFVDDDKQALKESKSGELPNMTLLRARLLFDGGYYAEALSEFKNTSIANFPTYRDQLEMTYRLGRIYQSMGKTDMAVSLYKKTLNNGDASSYYFAANSSLFIGNIFENTHQADSAAYYYRKCLEMKRHEYQNSIDQKARAGLERLGIEK